jgi:hypothetical protein
MSNETAVRLISSVGTTRTLELSDGSVIERRGGTVSWRNNNPGNLKFAFHGSADHSDHVSRTRDRALQQARERYDGVIALDQFGNVVFSSPEAGRAAQLQHLMAAHRGHTVEQMVLGYSTADYSGATHHSQQVAMIHRTAAERGQNLHGIAIGAMTAAQLDALAAGINRFEGFRVGETTVLHGSTHAATHGTAPHASPTHVPHAPDTSTTGSAGSGPHRVHPHQYTAHTRPGNGTADVLALQHSLNALGARDARGLPLVEDGDFGRRTREALNGFQRDHGMPEVAHAGPRTREAMAAGHGMRITDTRHPDYPLFERTLGLVQAAENASGIAPGMHSLNLAGALLVQMRRDGLTGIDRVDLSHPPRFARAVQHMPGSMQAEQVSMPVDTRTASRQSLHATSDMLAALPRPDVHEMQAARNERTAADARRVLSR